MSKLILTLPKTPDRVYFEPQWAVVDKGHNKDQEEKVIAVFHEHNLADRFVNDMNGRSFCSYYTRYIEKAL